MGRETNSGEEFLQNISKAEKTLASDAKQARFNWFPIESSVFPSTAQISVLCYLDHSSWPGGTLRITCSVAFYLYSSSCIEKLQERNPPTLLQPLFSLFLCTCSNPAFLEASQPLPVRSNSSVIIISKTHMQDCLKVFSFPPCWRNKWDSQLAWKANKTVIWAQGQSKQVLLLNGFLPAVSHNNRAAAQQPASPPWKWWDNIQGGKQLVLLLWLAWYSPLETLHCWSFQCITHKNVHGVAYMHI